MSAWSQALTALAASMVGIVAGTFFAFSVFVMPALARVPAAEAVRAMQSIDEVILGSLFMPVFMGAVVVSIAAIVSAFVTGSPTAPRVALICAAVLYVVGVIGVTGLGNVPLNERLAAFSTGDASAAWNAYYGPWMWLNHVRTLASTASLAALLVALRAA